MGEAIITRRECIGTLEDTSFAIIIVTYPEGSTCTCSNGTEILIAKDTSGEETFAIPEAGTWTVTATANDGSGDTKSESMEITEGQSVSIELVYQYSLIDGDGIDTSGFTALDADVEVYDDSIRVAYDSSSWIGTGYYYIVADLTNYNTLYIEGHYDIFNSNQHSAGVCVGNGAGSNSFASIEFSSDEKEIYTLDVSDCGANTYISIFAGAHNTDTQGWQSTRARIYNMWLE